MSKLLGHDTILEGDFLVDTDRKRIGWVGSLTGTRTLNEIYSALRDLFDDPNYTLHSDPMIAIDRHIYKMVNEWVLDEEALKHLTHGTLLEASGG